MTTQEIANFIKSQIKLGSSKEEVEKILTINHITPGDISAAFAITALEGVSETPKPAPATIPPGLTGIKTIADQEFPPPPAALDSIDLAAKQVTPVTPPSPPPRPASQLNVPIIPTMPAVPAPHHSHASRWFLFLLILIILGTGAYAYVVKPAWVTPLLDLIQTTIAKYTTTPEPVATTTPITLADPTADWLTYRNEQYGFEFKYPLENISKIEGSTNETFQMINTSGQSIKFDIDSLPAEELAGEVIFDQGGITIKKLCTVCEGPGPETAFDYNVIDQATSEKVHFLYLGYSRPSVAEFEQILSTFKFIEPVATSTNATSTATTTTSTSSSGLRGTSTASQPPEVNLPSLFLHP